jgi:hypothetical protein
VIDYILEIAEVTERAVPIGDLMKDEEEEDEDEAAKGGTAG